MAFVAWKFFKRIVKWLARPVNTITPAKLLPELRERTGSLTPKLEKLIRTLE
jgi:hypothetical protein